MGFRPPLLLLPVRDQTCWTRLVVDCSMSVDLSVDVERL